MLGKLVPCGGGAPVPLLKPTVVIGRNLDCDIAIACKSVSGWHCELKYRDGAWWARDLGSLNGTTVNGVRGEEMRVRPADLLSLGRQRFILVYQPSEAPTPAAVEPEIDALALRFFTDDDEAGAAAPAEPVKAPSSGPPSSRDNYGELVPCGGGDTIPLVHRELLVGRAPTCDIRLQYASISGKHCQLSLRDGYWFVQDLNSSNGTTVNGVRCQRKWLLPNSVLGLARHRFTVHYMPIGPGPPPEDEVEDIFSQSLLEKAGLDKSKLADKAPGPAPKAGGAKEPRRHDSRRNDS
jgi:adenylate cyclase